MENKVYSWTPVEAPSVPSTVDWSGTLYFKVINHSTGAVVLNHYKTINLLNVVVTSVAGGGKQSVLDISSAIFPVATNGVFNAAPGQYDLIYYLYVKLENLPYSSGYKYIGSNSVPLTIDANGTSFPKEVTQSQVQNTNTPTSLKVDGFTLDPSSTTPVYSCKSLWPFRIDFSNITECRTYTIKVDYADVTALGCGASPTYTSGLTYNLNAVYSGGIMQNYVELPNFNTNTPIINSGNNGKTFKLKITISNTGVAYCSAAIIYRCISVSGAAASTNLEIVNGGYTAPTTIIGSAPLLTYSSVNFNAARNATYAVSQFNISLEASKTTSGPWVTVYSGAYATPLSGGIPDVQINRLPAPANATFDSYPGLSIPTFTSWPLVWGINHGYIYYRLTVSVQNNCNTAASQFSYFKLNLSNPLTKELGDLLDISNEKPETFMNENIVSNINEAFSEELTNKIENYPNPFKNELTFTHLGEKSVILIYDLNQKIVGNFESNSDNYTFNTSNWMSSVYFYQIRRNDGTVSVGKIIKME